jgi:hypothetical protein
MSVGSDQQSEEHEMIEVFGINTDALTAELEYRRTTRARTISRRPLPRTSWWRRSEVRGH